MSDQLTLSINHDNDDGSTAELEKAYDLYENTEVHNRAVYTSSSHTPSARDQIALYRTPAKPAGNFAGQRKSAIRLTRDFSVSTLDATGTVKAPAIIGSNFSFPEGMTDAEELELRMTHIAMLQEEAVMYALTRNLRIYGFTV